MKILISEFLHQHTLKAMILLKHSCDLVNTPEQMNENSEIILYTSAKIVSEYDCTVKTAGDSR